MRGSSRAAEATGGATRSPRTARGGPEGANARASGTARRPRPSDGVAGDVSVLSRLIADGRLGEAAALVRRLARCGLPTWDALLWVGRIHEKAGRPAVAEQAFRRARALDPTAPVPLIELSRFLENAGRLDETREVLREGAAAALGDLSRLLVGLTHPRDRGGPDERLRVLFEFVPFRRVFLAELRRHAGAAERIAASMRRVLAADPGRDTARTLLADVLVLQGRPAAAERAAAAAVAGDSTDVDSSRLELVLTLIERGRYGNLLERALLHHARHARPAARILVDWPQVFSALICARRYRAAFRLGEALLDRLGEFETPQLLMYPWSRKLGRTVNEQRFLGAELRRLRAAARGGGHAHWFAYYRAILSDVLSRPEDVVAEFERIERLDPARYSWMRQAFVVPSLTRLDFGRTIAVCRSILARTPDHWWVRCRMAEAHLASGSRAAALRELARAEATVQATARREVLTWHGEVLLWLGDYRTALAKLDEAIALGAKTFTYGWRGATRLKLGDMKGAVDDLDRAVELDAKDFEALVWRGEAFRLLGRHEDALRDFDAFLAGQPGCYWGHFNRGLARDALGDEKGMADDYARIPPRVASFVRRELGLPGDRPPSRGEMRAVMAAALELGRGIRRFEDYVNVIWLPPSRRSGRRHFR